MLAIIADEKDERLPIDARASLIVLAAQLQALHTIGSIERRLIVQHRANEASERLQGIRGIGLTFELGTHLKSKPPGCDTGRLRTLVLA